MSTRTPPGADLDALDALLARHVAPLTVDPRIPGVAAAVVRGDRHATLAMGHRVRGRPAAVDASTRFEIGSVTKTFTALLLAEMVARGEVTYDDPLELHLPPAARPRSAAGPPVTLRRLATHTSGLPRAPRNLYLNGATQWFSNPYARYGTADLYRATARLRPPRRRDPEAVRYSTYGVGLLGQLLANAAGRDYPGLLAERVLLPLGMTATSARTGMPPAASGTACGHRRGRPVPPWEFDALAGAGAVRTTAADLVRYLRAHLRPDALSLTPSLAAALVDVRAPLAWGSREVKGRTLLWHTGGTGGFTAFVGFSPDADAGVAVLANATPVHRQPVVRAARRLFRQAVYGNGNGNGPDASGS